MRTEKDTMGKVQVPDDSYYGSQTQRAFENFQISNIKIPRAMISSIAMIKRSAAIVNNKLGLFYIELILSMLNLIFFALLGFLQ